MRTVQTRGIFGQPRAHAATSFRAEAISAGLAGEQATAKLIDRYGSEAMVFHGLKLPIKLRTDIDHLIVRDNAILAIDSKFWTAGRYWAFGGTLYRGLRKINAPEAMTHAVNALVTMLDNAPTQVNVLTVVHSKNHQARLGTSTRKLVQPMVAASVAEAEIDQWLADHPGEPDPILAGELVSLYRKNTRRS